VQPLINELHFKNIPLLKSVALIFPDSTASDVSVPTGLQANE
jgi:hypothetical protein